MEGGREKGRGEYGIVLSEKGKVFPRAAETGHRLLVGAVHTAGEGGSEGGREGREGGRGRVSMEVLLEAGHRLFAFSSAIRNQSSSSYYSPPLSAHPPCLPLPPSLPPLPLPHLLILVKAALSLFSVDSNRCT